MDNKTINLNSVDVYNKLYGLKTQHPLVAVIDLKQATKSLNHVKINYGIYALFLKNNASCAIRYGRKEYDYQEGSVVSFSPGQLIELDMTQTEMAPDVKGLIFHPDLIYGTPLGKRISEFGFFNYSEMEAVHLSDDERTVFLDCLQRISAELTHSVDNHSATVLSASIMLLLEYMNRFYDRQFITRHRVNSDVVARFEKHLKEFYNGPDSPSCIPGISYFADKANLSPGYFSDLIRKETGTTPKEMITLHLIAEAKHRLLATNEDISQIAYSLGFDYPAHFSRMFKRVTGHSPSSFRANA